MYYINVYFISAYIEHPWYWCEISASEMFSLSEDSMALRLVLSVLTLILILVLFTHLTHAYLDLEKDSDGDGLK